MWGIYRALRLTTFCGRCRRVLCCGQVKVSVENSEPKLKILIDPQEFLPKLSLLKDEMMKMKSAIDASRAYELPERHDPLYLFFDNDFLLGTGTFDIARCGLTDLPLPSLCTVFLISVATIPRVFLNVALVYSYALARVLGVQPGDGRRGEDAGDQERRRAVQHRRPPRGAFPTTHTPPYLIPTKRPI